VSAAMISPLGDASVLIELDEDILSDGPVEAAARTQALATRIRDTTTSTAGWKAVVPALTSVLVHVDPLRLAVEEAAAVLRSIAGGDDRWRRATWPDEAPSVEIPVRYGGEDGRDLEEAAAHAGISPADLVELHSSSRYRALFLGFAPGFAYLGPLPDALVLPRRASPRTRVPLGSVAIAGPHTAVYSVGSPGGWHILGRTSVPVWDPLRQPAALLEPGALVRFVPEVGS
jgi:KipI family sensor histidine kinase inhibitor